MKPWYQVANAAEVASPALLLYPERIRANIQTMIRIAGRPERLRPHVKTHKLAEVVRLQLAAGITKFKCATIAETEMTAGAGAKDVLVAYPVVGPNAARLLELARRFPAVRFSAVADSAAGIRHLGATFAAAGATLEVLLDVDCGMHRTGIEPGADALALYRLIAATPGLTPGGLHVYDGHLHEANLAQRTALHQAALAPVEAFITELRRTGLPLPRIVGGGTPTFPLHAQNPAVECSPGTCLLWDFGYGDKFDDLDFQLAALVLTRVVSKPGTNRLCLDLGHKAIAAENPHPRVKFFALPDAVAVTQSEEHLVVETAHAAEFAVGDCIYGVPRHICPTVALYAEATIINDGVAGERWRITARDRRIGV